MAKKTEKKTTTKKALEPKTKAKSAGAKKPAEAKAETPATVTDAAPANGAPATPPTPHAPDPRLPPPGTLLQKRDRHGTVRCECTVEADGVRYAGKVYKSLSSAAMAAAKDLGLTNKTQNGFVFWGLSKPARPAGDPLEALNHAWKRYQERATSIVEAVTDENRGKLRVAIEKQAKEIGSILAKVA